MWMTFFLLSALEVCFFFTPGFFVFKGLGRSWLESLCLAPVLSVVGYCVLGVVYAKLGIFASVWSVFAPALILSLLFYAAAFLWRKNRFDADRNGFVALDFGGVALYLGVSIVVAVLYFVIPLDGPASFVQDSDNSAHLSWIHSFASSGNYSILDVTYFHDLENANHEMLMSPDGAFYPAAWHLLAALGVSAFGVPVSMAANALNLAIMATVFPLSFFWFIRTVFNGHKYIVLAGAFICLGFAAFPWGAVQAANGPLYPLLLGFSFVPLFAALFIELLTQIKNKAPIGVSLFSCFLCFFAMAFAHPSAVFACAAFLLPYVIAEIYRAVKSYSNKTRVAILVSALATLVSILVWCVLYEVPFLRGITHFYWQSVFEPIDGLVNVLLGASARTYPQPIIQILIVAGSIWLLKVRAHRWIICSYVLALTLSFVASSTDGIVKSVLTGFWYTDPNRVAMLPALFGMPLAAVGLSRIMLFCSRISDRKFASYALMLSVACIVAVGVFFPRVDRSSDFRLATTAFGDIDHNITVANQVERPNLFDSEEMAFTQEVSDVVDQSYMIYNNADDGSPFAYALYDLNLCYRRSAAELTDGGESYGSELLRNDLDSLSTNQDVRRVLEECRIKYILILDEGGENTPDRCFYGYYKESKWKGINSISDETPGLKLLLSEGDMRLYEIEGLFD